MKLTHRLIWAYALYTLGLFLFIFVMGRIERATGPGMWIGYVFLFVPIAVYAVIGLLSRTSDLVEYYVAGRRVPAAFNGMATAADWLSAASFIGLAGSIYATGYDGLAYLMGWTGGYCLVAFLLAPYVRKLARYTIPDFLAEQRDAAPADLQHLFISFEDLWERKLWHQLTDSLIGFFNQKESAPQRLAFYKTFILTFADKINQLKLVTLALSAATQCRGTCLVCYFFDNYLRYPR